SKKLVKKLKVGTIFKWKNFPNPKSGEPKTRWFIYLGKTSALFPPEKYIISTTTTQISHFEIGGLREKHDYIKYDQQSSPFNKECILDLDEIPYSDLLSILINNDDIEVMGELNTNKKLHLYNRILKSEKFSKILKKDIHTSLNNDGITGLKNP